MRFNLVWLASIAFVGTVSGSIGQDFNAEPPNAPDQTPVFVNQTRAPIISVGIEVERLPIATGLQTPWGMDQLPDGRWIVTERRGRLRIISDDGAISDPIRNVPEVDDRGQGGLLDIVIDQDFATSRRLWFSFAENRGGGHTGTAVATAVLSENELTLEDVKVIFRQEPAWRSTLHYGSRLVFDRTGALFVTTGERSNVDARPLAQDPATHLGKVLRIDPINGGAAEGNPQIAGGAPEVWSYGHRNPQSAALSPEGELWTVEHGPRGGDELNRPEAGKNYGWPVISYGSEYSGRAVGEGQTSAPGMEQPIYYWDPVIAPSGMAFYAGEMFPEWNNDVLIGGLASRALVRLQLEGNKVVGEARYLEDQDRIRDVDVDQKDGSIVVLIDSERGGLYRIVRK